MAYHLKGNNMLRGKPRTYSNYYYDDWRCRPYPYYPYNPYYWDYDYDYYWDYDPDYDWDYYLGRSKINKNFKGVIK